MSCWLMPDYMFEKFDDITPEFLKNIGVRALVIDIDNTLAPYEEPIPNERVIAWLELIRKNGIGAALISNNTPERVELFNRNLGLLAYPDAGKPSGKYIKIALDKLGADASQAAVLGDQLLTDAWAGKHLGLKALIVPPIKDRKNLFFRFKRLLEKPFVYRYKVKNRKEKKQ